jgi:phosphohistidine phosphatase
MDIILFRHGKAGKSKEYPVDDFSRPLTDEGRHELVQIAGWLRRQFPDPDLIATSPLTRASQTAEIVAKELRTNRSFETWDELAPGNDPKTVLHRMRIIPKDQKIIIVGHEPDLSTFGAYILTGKKIPFFTLSKGGLAILKDVTPRQAGSGSLHLLMPAKLMI